MQDDINIVIGAKSDVRAGVNQAERDLRRGVDRMRDNMDRAMRGKGFMESFGRIFRGDISGGIEELTDKAGAGGGKGLFAKFAMIGGGLATALVAGWKAGRALDDMLGISDKVSAAWNKAAVEAGNAWDKFYKKLRSDRERAEKEQAIQFELDSKVFDIREQSRLKAMTPAQKVSYYEEGVQMADTARRAPGITPEERSTRTVAYEQMKADYEEALAANSQAHAAELKQEWLQQQDAEERKRQIISDTDELMRSFAEQKAKQDRDNALREIDNAQEVAGAKVAAAQVAADGAKKARAEADRLAILVHDPAARKADHDKQKAEERAKDRNDRMDAEMAGRMARGVRGPAIDRWLGAKEAAAKAAQAEKQAAKLQQEANALTKKISDDLAKIRQQNERLLAIGGGE